MLSDSIHHPRTPPLRSIRRRFLVKCAGIRRPSKRWLILFKAKVTIDTKARDVYRRSVANVKVKGGSVNVVIIKPDDVGPDSRVQLVGRQARHVLEVLGGSIGQSLRVGLIDGALGRGTIERIEGNRVTIRCAFDQAPPNERTIDVVLALPRPKVLKRLWAQLSALGVRRIFLTNAAKVERNYFDTHWLEKENFGPLLVEGLEQAGDTRLPEVRVIRQLKPFLEDEADALFGATRLIAHPAAEGGFATIPDMSDALTLAIGPEGGWTAFEMDLFTKLKFIPIGLGHRILRSDTACVALLAALRAAWDQ